MDKFLNFDYRPGQTPLTRALALFYVKLLLEGGTVNGTADSIHKRGWLPDCRDIVFASPH